MDYNRIQENDELPLSVLNKSRLNSLIEYATQKLWEGRYDELTIAQIAHDNRMTIPQLVALVYSKVDLACQAVHAANELMIGKFMNLNIHTLGKNSSERISNYLLKLFQHDLAQLKFRIEVQRYSWLWSVVSEDRLNNQAMKLMAPIYLEYSGENLDRIDARCTAVWALYKRTLRQAAIYQYDANDCINECYQSICLLSEGKSWIK